MFKEKVLRDFDAAQENVFSPLMELLINEDVVNIDQLATKITYLALQKGTRYEGMDLWEMLDEGTPGEIELHKIKEITYEDWETLNQTLPLMAQIGQEIKTLKIFKIHSMNELSPQTDVTNRYVYNFIDFPIQFGVVEITEII